MKTIKMQQFVAFIAIIVTLNSVNIKIISAAMSEEEVIENKVKAIREKCIAAAGLSAEQRKLIFDHKLFTATTTVANTPKEIQCYCRCYLNEAGIFKDDKPNEKMLQENLPLMINDKKKAKETLEKCSKIQAKDKCEFCFSYELCLIRETDLYIFQ